MCAACAACAVCAACEGRARGEGRREAVAQRAPRATSVAICYDAGPTSSRKEYEIK